MFRRIVAGIILSAILFGTAFVVSHGMRHPGFLRPSPDFSAPLRQATATAQLAK